LCEEGELHDRGPRPLGRRLAGTTREGGADDRDEECYDREGGPGDGPGHRRYSRDRHDGGPDGGHLAGHRTTGPPCRPGHRGGRQGRDRAIDPDHRPVDPDRTVEELVEIRGDLVREIAERRADYDRALAELTSLQQSAGDGAGDDQADAGSKTFEREQELSIANNRRDLLVQMERAMERLDKGTYGNCESCHEPIMKARLQAFPSATLCVRCKQREERR
jgi:RNA polymerase-binding protein DksA